MQDCFKDECGIVGVWKHHEAANLAYLSLYAQQHRGQEGAGVVSFSGESEKQLNSHKGMGLVADIFSGYNFEKLPGDTSIGHVRYTTAGGNFLQNVQPFTAHIAAGNIALAHNGNLINTDSIKADLISDGAILNTTSDSELFLHLFARTIKHGNIIDGVQEALRKVKGAYSLVVLLDDRLLAIRDPNGVRPLAMGTLGGAIVFASETCAFDLIGAQYIRDVEPGEIVEVSGDSEIKSYFPFGKTKASPCIFEYIYFARPDSKVFGKNVYSVRKKLGEELAKEHPVEGDIVIPVPDSGVTAALGFSHASKIPLELGLIRNHYVGRTFIEPKQSIRDFGVKIKLNANAEILQGKKVVVVDDSIVRGTTSKKLVSMLRSAGAKEVHMRISAPPTTGPCYYGIDTPNQEELIAYSHSIAEIAKYIGVDSLGYLSNEGMYRAVEEAAGSFCDACFTGNYPLGKPEDFKRFQTKLL